MKRENNEEERNQEVLRCACRRADEGKQAMSHPSLYSDVKEAPPKRLITLTRSRRLTSPA
ncbi:hypothetical protein E2C01_065568 [Portunus trituberculatus]|uniref:Uncharacterized protein n=1 Tax=Portunus trituberculatus TaxID=210409 RepID=A0A5B7HNR5_PORTR|nr:hypothetical protein [Portunus trituberculatus]